MESIYKDLRFSLRVLINSPGFTFVAILTLALGIGANSAVFSIVNSVLLKPLPYQDPDKLVVALHGGTSPVSPADFFDWKRQANSFEQLAAAEIWGPNLTGRDRPEQIQALRATDNLFALLGVQPVLGRGFLPGEDQPGAQPVVVLSQGLWQRRFGGDQKILGQTLTLDGNSYTVIGVMPPGFQFPMFWATNAEMWAPLVIADRTGNRAARSLRIFGRLKPDVSLAQAQTEMSAITARLTEQYPKTNTESNVSVIPLKKKVVGDVQPTLLVLLSAVGLVLLIACINIANLLLARASGREKEIAVRLALGATRFRLVRQMLTESLLLALIGGGAGLLLAFWSVNLFLSALPEGTLPRSKAISLDTPALVFTLLLTLLTGLFFGLAPAWQATRPDLNEALKAGGRNAAANPGSHRLRSLLVVSQVALALMLLIGAGLLIRSFMKLQSVDPGFSPRNVLTMTVSVAGSAESDGARRAVFYQQLLERIDGLPGVESSSAINHLPLDGDVWGFSFSIEGRPAPEPGERMRAAYRVALPGYFHTMGISLDRGRDFTDRDTKDAPGVIIINETLARRYWPNEDPIGKRIKMGSAESDAEWLSIAGVVKDVKQEEWTEEPGNEVYLPFLQEEDYLTNPKPHYAYLTLVARTSSDPAALAAQVRNEVWAIDKNLPVSRVATMEQVIAEQLWRPRFLMLLLGSFASVALLLAAVGIYGVMSYAVARRTHEIGIRMALGAQAGDVLRLVVGQALALALTGVAAGLAAAFALTRVVSGLLFGVSATDPLIFIAIPLILTGVALAACFIPARRAARVDPMVALRCE